MQDVVVTVNTGPGLHVAFVHTGKAVSENKLFLIKNTLHTKNRKKLLTQASADITNICKDIITQGGPSKACRKKQRADSLDWRLERAGVFPVTVFAKNVSIMLYLMS